MVSCWQDLLNFYKILKNIIINTGFSKAVIVMMKDFPWFYKTFLLSAQPTRFWTRWNVRTRSAKLICISMKYQTKVFGTAKPISSSSMKRICGKWRTKVLTFVVFQSPLHVEILMAVTTKVPVKVWWAIVLMSSVHLVVHLLKWKLMRYCL